MVTRWLELQERWAAEQGQKYANLASALLDPDWDEWACIDVRATGRDKGSKKRFKRS